VVGARPQFVKLAPVAAALHTHGIDHIIVHTGQHYDENMSGVFFEDLAIPEPDVNLEVGSGSHGQQTGEMLIGLDPVLQDAAPDWVLVYGDTNSTLAAAISAVKMHLPLAHLEAGLRSHNRRMPEEHNRVLTDHAADLLLCPTELAHHNLIAEGLGDQSVVVGDVMTDICLKILARADSVALPASVPDSGFLLSTIHRAENTDDPARLAAIVSGLQQQPEPVVLTAHPRLLRKAAEAGYELNAGNVTAIEPLPYPQMVKALAAASGVITDSGGLQKEAYLVGTPCTTLRTETEWQETVAEGWNQLDPQLEHPKTWSWQAQVDSGAPRTSYGEGSAADLVARELLKRVP